MEARSGVRWDGHSPWKFCGEARVGAFGEVTKREEGPGKGGAGCPGIQSAQKRQVTEAEVNRGRDGRKEKT